MVDVLAGVLVFLVIFTGVAALYLGLLVLGTRRWLGPTARRTFVLAVIVGIAGYLLSLFGVLVVGEYLRHEPPGLGNPYRMPDQTVGRAVLYLVHGGVLLATTAFAYRLGGRRTGGGWTTAIAAIAAVGGYVVLTLPWTEFARICMTDLTLVMRPSC